MRAKIVVELSTWPVQLLIQMQSHHCYMYINYSSPMSIIFRTCLVTSLIVNIANRMILIQATMDWLN